MENLEPSRRQLLLGAAGAVLLGSGAAAQDARAAVPPPSVPGVTAWAVTRNHAALVVRAKTGEVVQVQHGLVSRCQKAVDGIAVLGLAVRSESVSRLVITSETLGCQVVAVDTSASAVEASLLRVVNKRIAMVEHDQPSRLVSAHGVQMDPRAESSLDGLLSEASGQGVRLKVISGFRAFDDQKKLYAAYSARDGQAAADRFSARPGHSEHQLGLAFDLGALSGQDQLDPSFGDTPEGRWIAAHAHDHGFVVRYCKGQERLSGYEPEPWHIRYVGPDVARFLSARPDIHTLEELFGLPAAPGY